MRQYAILLFLLLGVMGCKEKPYVENIKEMKKHELSGVIIFPTDQSILSSDNFRDGVSVKATVSGGMPLTDCRWLIRSEHQREEDVLSGQGLINGAHCQIEGALNGDKLIDGRYYLKVHATDASGLELSDVVQSFQVLKKVPEITIDQQSPVILGAIDGTPQRPYAQETINYRQKLVGAESNARYVIEPVEIALAINWQKIPTIYRWYTRLDDSDTAPGYAVRVSDDNKLKEVRYKIAPKCSSFDEADLTQKVKMAFMIFALLLTQ